MRRYSLATGSDLIRLTDQEHYHVEEKLVTTYRSCDGACDVRIGYAGLTGLSPDRAFVHLAWDV